MAVFKEIAQSLVVLYRASASHKKLLVQGLMYSDIDEQSLNAEQD
jgi:hypothetical protein